MRRLSPHFIAVGALLLALFGTPLAAQLGPGPFAAFPTADETDGRFLGFGCPGFATFESGVSITLSAGPTETQFTLNVFDGDTTGTVPTGHWDVGTRQLLYQLFFDPFRQRSTDPANLVGQWTGNAANPLTNPIVDPDRQWTVSSALMPDNDWWAVTVGTSPLAQPEPGSNFFYHLRIEADGACIGTEQLEANIKIAASNPLSFAAPRFAFVAALRQLANDIPIIYPGAPPFPAQPAGGFVNFPTTFDGTFTFSLNVLPGVTSFELFDGDFDHGTNPAQLIALPSNAPLFDCTDTDDLDTPADYGDFPPTLGTAGANPEGVVVAGGIPADDNRLDLFRRGELGAAFRRGCVRYEITDAAGNVYRNDNPSSNLEWERFRIVSTDDPDFDPGCDPNLLPGCPTYDQVAPTPLLAPGTWSVRFVGLDMSNLNFIFAQLGVCSNIENEEAFAELNFDRDAAGNTLPDETTIAEQWASQGVHFATDDPLLHPLRILDSADPIFDAELGTPNEDFGGPGIGAGGSLGQPGENTLAQGNILVITESTELPSSDFPGSVFVTFDSPKNVQEVHLIDIDGNGGTVAAFDAPVGGSLLGMFAIANLGPNSFQAVAVNLFGVRRLEIVLPTGGGVARITSGAIFVPNCPPPVFALGDTVWYDTNGSSSQAAGEVGIPGVLLELLATGNPTPVATALTGDVTNPNSDLCRKLNTTANPGDESGLYCFLVPPGDYTVRVAASNFDVGGPLSGLASTTGGETQSDTVVNTNVLTYDFGYRGAGSIGDRVWLDTNGDGVQDGGETGINGVTVELRDGDGNLIGTQLTAGDGNYLFENLPPGDYTVTAVSSTVPAGLDPTFDLDGIATPHIAAATLAPNENRTDVDFGYRGTASLGDRVWLDTSGDGVQNVGEAGINGVTVRLLDGGGNLVATQVTAGDGLYTFTGLGAGTYTVEVVAASLPPGLTQTYDLDGLGTAHTATTSLAAAQNRVDVDFGYRQVQVVGSLGDRVWFDNNGNGVQDGAGEPGINGVTVRLFNNSNTILDTQVTAGDGNYLFTNLPAGTYRVEVDPATLPGALVQTYDLDGLSTPGKATAALGSGQTRLDVDFGYAKCKQCAGGVETLQLVYLGNTAATVKVKAVSGATKVEIFNATVQPGGTISLVGPGGSPFFGLLGTSIEVYLNNVLQTAVAVGCQNPIGPGLMSGSFLVLAGISKNGGPLCPVNDSWCVAGSQANTTLGVSGNHAFWLPGIDTDLLFVPNPGSFTFNAGGTAQMSGTVVSLGNSAHGFNASVSFSGLTSATPSGSPKKEFSASVYKENGGPVDTNTWAYFTSFSGTLTGTGAYAGAVINFSRTGPAFQLGIGANNKNLNFGGSGWFLWQVVSQPTSGTLTANGQGDINVDFQADCEQACVDGFVLDRFDAESFSNNNGTLNWSGSWIETDVAGAGPSAGNVKVWSNALKLKDAPDTGTEPSGAREVNLAGAASATLSFNYSTSAGVDTTDSVVVEISKNGGSTYTVLETFTNVAGATSGSRSYNLASHIASNTRVRFRVKANYGGDDEWFLADNVKITRTCPSTCSAKTFQDNFDAVSFSNNNGSHSWSASWVESDVAGAGPSAGNIKVWSNALKLKDAPDTGTEPSAAREANLSGALSATLTFNYSTSAGVDTTDSIVVEISKDGGSSYSVLETFTNVTGATSGSRSYSISSYIASNTRVRFRVKASYGGDDEWFLADVVKITTGCDPCAPKTFADNFDAESFSNNNGSHNWSAAWVENDIAGSGPSAGGIKVWSNALKLKDAPDTGTEPSAAREANLLGAAAATLTFKYSTSAGVDTTDSVVVEISKDGGVTYTVLETFTNLTGATSGTRTYNASGYIASNTRVRFRVKANYGGDDEWFLADNVKITTTCPTSSLTRAGDDASGR